MLSCALPGVAVLPSAVPMVPNQASSGIGSALPVSIVPAGPAASNPVQVNRSLERSAEQELPHTLTFSQGGSPTSSSIAYPDQTRTVKIPRRRPVGFPSLAGPRTRQVPAEQAEAITTEPRKSVRSSGFEMDTQGR